MKKQKEGKSQIILNAKGVIAALLVMCIFTGCGKEQKFDVDAVEDSINHFEEASDTQNTEVIGTISHGIVWSSEEVDELQYEGGEMEISYKVNASGTAASCGFLIFIDGIPQPYKVKDITKEYESLHIFKFEEETDETFFFVFTPVTGKKGDCLSICIVSIINPGFYPDRKETFSYGHSHKALEGIYTLKFLDDAENSSDNIEGIKIGENLDITENTIKQEELERYTEHGEELSLDQDVITELYIEDEDMQLSESYEIGEKDKIHMKYKIMGHPGLKYKTTFYIDHNPIVIDGEIAVTSHLKNGEVEKMEFDLDASQLENKTFYAISVPCNKEDYPNDPVCLYKTNSILFY